MDEPWASRRVSVTERVNHPLHYGGALNPYEAIKVIEAWRLNFCCGNTFKYLSRAGRKDSPIGHRAKLREDIDKARWYLERQYQGLQEHNAAAWVQALHFVPPIYEVDAVMAGAMLDYSFRPAIDACRFQTDIFKIQQGLSCLTSIMGNL